MDPHGHLLPPAAPDWSLLVGDAGRGLIWLSAAMFALALLAGFLPAIRKLGTFAFVAGCLGLLGAFGCLTSLFVGDQFQYTYVWSHGESNTDLKYKIAGVWTGQEGSFLLWACCSALFALLTLRAVGPYRRHYVGTYAAFLGALCGILAYESPFLIADSVRHAGQVLMPPDGSGMTPSLRNYWVVIHPPTIFLGFGSLSVLFCWAVAAMLRKDPADWVRPVRPWALLSVAILGLGIAMGGFWAYETLGWGGFWAWDPVENVSFVPWLFGVAFVHGLIVQTTRGRWTSANLLMGGLPFVAFAYGTFLTRSGYLSDASVHSFAEMKRSALWILLVLVLASAGGFFGLWAGRGRKLGDPKPVEPGLNRESAYKAGALLLCLLGLAVAIGMSVPFFMALAQRPSKVVGEGLYHLVVAWFFVPIMLLIASGPFLSWRSMGLRELGTRLMNVLSISVGLLGFAYFGIKFAGWNVPIASPEEANFGTFQLPFGVRAPLMPWLLFLLFLCVFATVGNLWRIAEVVRRSSAMSIGGFVAHLGIAVMMAGLILSRGLEQKQRAFVQQGVQSSALGYVISFQGFKGREGVKEKLADPETKAEFDLMAPGGGRLTARPTFYFAQRPGADPQPVVWPHIERSLASDLYFAMAPPIYTVWDEPLQIRPGETKTLNGVAVTYERMVRQGEAGQAGTTFAAKLHLKTPEGAFHAAPGITVGKGQGLFAVGHDYWITMSGMDAATKAVVLEMFYRSPFYPLELYVKPMTILVWLGTGILTLGGLMAALYRRVRAPESAPAPLQRQAEVGSETPDALIPTA